MSIAKKMEERTQKFINDYNEQCNDKANQQLTDFFGSMLYKNMNHHILVSLGHKTKRGEFESYLSSYLDSFSVVLGVRGNSPMFSIKDNARHILSFNMDYVTNAIIDEEIEGDYGTYTIYFTYKNMMEYMIRIYL